MFSRVQYATDELWIPSTSLFKSNKEWRNLNFQRNTRYENIMFKGENVLTPNALRQVCRKFNKSLELSSSFPSTHPFIYHHNKLESTTYVLLDM